MTESTTITIITNAEINPRQSLSIPKRLLQEPVKKYLKSGINPLIDSAAVLFMMASRVSALTMAPSLSELKHYATHELQRFETALSQQGVASETAQCCTTLLALLIENAIMRAPWNQNLVIPEPFLSSNAATESLRPFIEKNLEEPSLDFIEFLYAVLSLGGCVPGMDETYLKEQCYAIIQESSEQKKLAHLSPSTQTPPKESPSYLTILSPGLIILIASVLLLTVFSSIDFFTSRATQQAYHAARSAP